MKRSIGAVLIMILAATLNAGGAEVETRQGDWIVTGAQRVAGRHIRLDGSLVLEKNARLELEDCTLEFIAARSREHLLDWKGGTLVTRRCTLGGFVRPDGTPIHTVFHLYDGAWEATDTVVQYSYGISFGQDTGGRLSAIRLKAGPRPDAIIASGKADISLTDCEFPIAVSIYTDAGGTGKLTAGFGARQNPAENGGNIGPEFTFGLALDAALKEPVLLIKTAWGGKSLYYDFRPPSAGVYPRTPDDIAKDRNPESGSGRYYRLMGEHVKKVARRPGARLPRL